MIDASIYIGWDPRERDAFDVCRCSLLRHIRRAVSVHKLTLKDLQNRGLYKRTTLHDGATNRLIDVPSRRPDYPGWMSTEHAIARFFVPLIAKTKWALFMDGDMLVRGDISEVFDGLDDSKALYCVNHYHAPANGPKMDGQAQTQYPRKNWSSFVVFNTEAWPWRSAMYASALRDSPGRDLHAFSFCTDDQIGFLDRKWNHLVGWSDPQIDPTVVHFTEGLPDMPGYENCDYADEWRAELERIRVPFPAVSAG